MTERGFNTDVWSDRFFERLSPLAKLLAVYLKTNDHCNQAGLYRVRPRTISYETGITLEELDPLWESLSPDIEYFPQWDIVWIKNFIIEQTKSPDFLVAVGKCLSKIDQEIPEAGFWSRVSSHIHPLLERYSANQRVASMWATPTKDASTLSPPPVDTSSTLCEHGVDTMSTSCRHCVTTREQNRTEQKSKDNKDNKDKKEDTLLAKSHGVPWSVFVTSFEEWELELNSHPNGSEKIGVLVEAFKTLHAKAPSEDIEKVGPRLGKMSKGGNEGYILKLIWQSGSADIKGSHLDYIQGMIRRPKDRPGGLPSSDELRESWGQA